MSGPETVASNVSSADAVLSEALTHGFVQHPEGHRLDVKANISVPNSAALDRFVRMRKPRQVIEIGMAYGVSTLTILAAMEANGCGALISIDPYVGWPTGRRVALHQVARAGVSHRHSHHYAASHEVLPCLLKEMYRPELIYIDGNHDFEYVFTDYFLSDKLLPIGGVMAFNDAGWTTVHRVIRFLMGTRRYRELDVGLPKVYRSRNPVFSLIKRMEGRSTYDRYFEKIVE